LALTFGMETREDTVQFRRRTSVWGIIDRSVVNRPPPQKTVVILVGGQSVRARPVRSGSLSCPDRFFPGIATHCPRPLRGRGRRPEAGRGGGFAVPPPAGRGRAPSPVHCPGEPGDTPRSPPTLRWVGTITRIDMGVQQNLHLADSQPGTQVHPCGKFAPMGAFPLPAQGDTRKTPSRNSTPFPAGSWRHLVKIDG